MVRKVANAPRNSAPTVLRRPRTSVNSDSFITIEFPRRFRGHLSGSPDVWHRGRYDVCMPAPAFLTDFRRYANLVESALLADGSAFAPIAESDSALQVERGVV